jgi:hypothetical protein
MTPAEFRDAKQRHRESPEAAADPKLLLGPRNQGHTIRNGVEGEARPALQGAGREERCRQRVIGHVGERPVSLGDLVQAEALYGQTGAVTPALSVRSSSFAAATKTGPFGVTTRTFSPGASTARCPSERP